MKLAMGEYWHLQIDTDVFEGLALRFVDRHGERKFDGKLVASENEGVVAVSRRQGKCDARNQSNFTVMVTTNQLHLRVQHPSHCSQQNHFCPITESFGWCEVAEKDERAANFHLELARRKP